MSRVVLGVGASHTTLMNTKWDEVDHLARAHEFRNALGGARQLVDASGADLAVVIGPNHFRGLWLDLMPTFTLGIGEVIGAGEHGTPSGPLPTDPDAARSLLDHVMADGFDPAFSTTLQVDHGITHAIQYVVPEGMPVVPVIVNSFAPPLPRVARCARLGAALGRAVAQLSGDRRVALIASGGLSHQLPFPDWRRPDSDDDRFLVESWTNGRGNWAEYEPRRRGIVTAAPPVLREDFDQRVLSLLDDGRLDELTGDGIDLTALGGNGAAEMRNWVAMAAACGWAPGRTLTYSPMPEWLTGMAVAVIDRPFPPDEEPPP